MIKHFDGADDSRYVDIADDVTHANNVDNAIDVGIEDACRIILPDLVYKYMCPSFHLAI